VLFRSCHVTFTINEGVTELANQYLKFTKLHQYDLSKINGCLIAENQDINTVNDLLVFNKHFPLLKTISISGNNSDVFEELSEILGNTSEILTQLIEEGYKASEIAQVLRFELNIDTDYFASIAKIRALRILLDHLMQSFDITAISINDLYIHSICTAFTDETDAPHGNMLKGATAAKATIIGGTSALTVLPEDSSDSMQRRIARNVSNVLKEESYLNKVAEPAAGSYYLEHLTDVLIKAVWTNFQSHLSDTKNSEFKSNNQAINETTAEWNTAEQIKVKSH